MYHNHTLKTSCLSSFARTRGRNVLVLILRRTLWPAAPHSPGPSTTSTRPVVACLFPPRCVLHSVGASLPAAGLFNFLARAAIRFCRPLARSSQWPPGTPSEGRTPVRGSTFPRVVCLPVDRHQQRSLSSLLLRSLGLTLAPTDRSCFARIQSGLAVEERRRVHSACRDREPRMRVEFDWTQPKERSAMAC